MIAMCLEINGDWRFVAPISWICSGEVGGCTWESFGLEMLEVKDGRDESWLSNNHFPPSPFLAILVSGFLIRLKPGKCLCLFMLQTLFLVCKSCLGGQPAFISFN